MYLRFDCVDLAGAERPSKTGKARAANADVALPLQVMGLLSTKDLILVDGKTSRFVAGFLIFSIALQI